MDPGEQGVHGAWLLELRPLAPAEPRLIPLASVRYAGLEVDVTGIDAVADLHARVNERLRYGIANLVEESGARLRVLSLRMRMVGATALHRQIERELSRLPGDFDWRSGDASAFVELITPATRPVRDLEALSRGDDAVALLARLANDLSDDSRDAAAGLLDGVRGVATVLLDARQYRSIDDLREPLGEAAVRSIAELQALSLLDELLAQKELA